MTDSREQTLRQWSLEHLPGGSQSKRSAVSMTQVSGDASFRRYFRLRDGGQSWIAVDAPPEQEDSHRFVAVARLLEAAGLNVPAVYAVDFEQGFMLLSDLGDSLYLGYLQDCQRRGDLAAADACYRQAIDSLVRLQQCVDKERLDPYDRRELHGEMALFDQWFCRELLEMELEDEAVARIAQTYAFLEDAALSQTEVAVHRDFHSRNLMLPASAAGGPGLVDFQDAVRGAYTYDLVSLLRDCYIVWPREQVLEWARYYREQAHAAGIIGDIDPDAFQRDFDLMGLQRNLKVMGIFSRLSLRDKKSAYLADIPLVLRYFREVANRHPEMADFLGWFDREVMPLATNRLKLEG